MTRPNTEPRALVSANMSSRMGSKDDAHPGSILLVVHDFIARSADELSLAKGDRIELIERDDDFGDGWFLGRHMANGNTGLFPEGEDACCLIVRHTRRHADGVQSIPRQRRKARSPMPPTRAEPAKECKKLVRTRQIPMDPRQCSRGIHLHRSPLNDQTAPVLPPNLLSRRLYPPLREHCEAQHSARIRQL